MRAAALASQGGHMESAIPVWWRPYYPEHENWHPWKGENGLFYASRATTSPPCVQRADTPELLAQAVKAAESDLRSWWEL
jgi:hypothetical protein